MSKFEFIYSEINSSSKIFSFLSLKKSALISLKTNLKKPFFKFLYSEPSSKSFSMELMITLLLSGKGKASLSK